MIVNSLLTSRMCISVDKFNAIILDVTYYNTILFR